GGHSDRRRINLRADALLAFRHAQHAGAAAGAVGVPSSAGRDGKNAALGGNRVIAGLFKLRARLLLLSCGYVCALGMGPAFTENLESPLLARTFDDDADLSMH